MKALVKTLALGITLAAQSLTFAGEFPGPMNLNRPGRDTQPNGFRPAPEFDEVEDPQFNPAPRPQLLRPAPEPRIGNSATASGRLGMAYETLPSGQILVKQVFPSGGAEAAGLQINDVIYFVDGLDVAQVSLEEARMTRPVEMTVLNARSQRWRMVSFLPAEMFGRPQVGNPLARLEQLGVSLETLMLGTVKVSDLSFRGIGAELGLQNGDILLTINNRQATLDTLARESRGSFTLTVRRGRQTMTFTRTTRQFDRFQPEFDQHDDDHGHDFDNRFDRHGDDHGHDVNNRFDRDNDFRNRNDHGHDHDHNTRAVSFFM